VDNDVSLIIDRTALIENILNQIIHGYTSPRKDAFEFFWNVVLDSSVMQLGSKIKVAMAISQELNAKLDENSLHKVISYRNAFAHHDTNAHPVITFGKAGDDQINYMLHIMKSSGKIKKECRNKALIEFNNNYKKAKESLIVFLDTIKELHSK